MSHSLCLNALFGTKWPDTCPQSWMESLVRCFEQVFEIDVSINFLFAGGYIIRSHAAELPWVQIEFPRAPIFSTVEKQKRLLAALEKWYSFNDKNRGVPLLSEYKALREEQDELLLKWEQSQDKLETTKKDLGAGVPL